MVSEYKLKKISKLYAKLLRLCKPIILEASEVLDLVRDGRGVIIRDSIYESSGYYSERGDIFFPEHYHFGKSVTIPISWSDSEFGEWRVITITISPIMRNRSAIESVKEMFDVCSRCLLKNCADCEMVSIVGYAVEENYSGKILSEDMSSFFHTEETTLYIVAKERIVLQEEKYAPTTSDYDPEWERRIEDVYPIREEIVVEPNRETFHRLHTLYQKAIEKKDKLEKLAKLVRILVKKQLLEEIEIEN